MKNALHLLFLAVLLALSVCARAELTCGDLLDRIGQKPAVVEYQSCEIEKDRQGEPYTALYRVEGSDAVGAEAYLSAQFNMPALRRSCCVWDAPNGSYLDKQTGHSFAITLSSEETIIDERQSWLQIPYFYIRVSGYSELP